MRRWGRPVKVEHVKQRCVSRATIRNHVGLGKYLEGADDTQGDIVEYAGRNEWQGNAKEIMPNLVLKIHCQRMAVATPLVTVGRLSDSLNLGQDQRNPVTCTVTSFRTLDTKALREPL